MLGLLDNDVVFPGKMGSRKKIVHDRNQRPNDSFREFSNDLYSRIITCWCEPPPPCCSFAHDSLFSRENGIAHLLITKHQPKPVVKTPLTQLWPPHSASGSEDENLLDDAPPSRRTGWRPLRFHRLENGALSYRHRLEAHAQKFTLR